MSAGSTCRDDSELSKPASPVTSSSHKADPGGHRLHPQLAAGNFPLSSSTHTAGSAVNITPHHSAEVTHSPSAGSPSSKNTSPVRYTSSTTPATKRLFPNYHRQAASAPLIQNGTEDAASERKIGPISTHLTRPKKVRQLPPIDRGAHLTVDMQEQLCKRLYELSVQRLKMKIEKQEALIKKHEFPNKSLTVEQQDEMVQRMYYSQLKHDEVTAKKLAEKYITIHPFPVINKDQVEETNKRLYYDRREMKKDNYQKLYEKYITQTNPTFLKMTPDIQEAMVQRLHAKGGA